MAIKHIFLALLVTLIWGCNYVFVKLGVHEIPPLFLCAIRFFLASVPAIFFLPFPKSTIKLIGFYGMVMFALQFSAIFIGISLGTGTGIASLLLQTSAFFSILFASIFMREIPSVWQIAGACLSFTGVVIAAHHVDHTNMPISGFLCVLVGAVFSGFGNVTARKLGHISTATLVSWGCFIAFPPLLIMSLLTEGPAQILSSLHHVSWVGVVSLLYIVYMSTWVGYGAWSWLLARYPVSMIVPFSLLQPVFAMIISVIFLHEGFEPWKLTVTCLVLGGLGVNLFAPRLIKQLKRMQIRDMEAIDSNAT